MLLAATCLLAGVVAMKDPALLSQGLEQSGRLLGGVLPELLLGFLIAGLIDVIVRQPALVRWLGEQHLAYGILAGCGVGLVVPGGPSLLFPLAATLLRQGAAPGPLIAMLTARILLSPIRMVSYEAPALGVAPDACAFSAKPVVAAHHRSDGAIGHWLFHMFRK
jgi:uncharacterized protein